MNYQKTLRAALSAALSLAMLATAALAAPPDKPGGSSGSVTYDGATTITESTTQSGQTYKSSTGNQNALLATGGTSDITNPTVTKTGSPSGRSDDYDFYGTNAAVLAANGAVLQITGGSVATDASDANAVYAYGTGSIRISGTTIQTSSNNSGGIMVTGGGTLDAADLTVSTSGNSAAAIRSDRGGGTLTVTGGRFTTSGTGSPVIYSTADITVTDAELTATASEGVVVEGGNSVTLNNVTMRADNNKLNGQSATYKGVFLYQSMSGDASSGGGSFTASDSTITNENGDVFFVTNNSAAITLKNNTIVNNDASGALLRAQAGAWGTSGSNGGHVTMTLDNQTVAGDIYIDDISTLTLVLKNGSRFTGTINGDNTAKSIVVTLSADSTLNLTGESYVYSLENADSTGSNITGDSLHTGAGVSGGAASGAGSSAQNGASGNGQTPPERPDGTDGFPGGQTPPERPDGTDGFPGGQTPPDKPDGADGFPGGQTPPEKPDGAEQPPETAGTGQQTPAGDSLPAVVLSPQTLTVNGTPQKPEAYNIGGTNFFKLRDLAALLSGTSSQFNVTYDQARNTVVITTGEAYDGTFSTEYRDNAASAVKSPQQVEIDGRSVSLTAYNIGGANFFGLRELSAYLGYEVGYDAASNTAVVQSK